MLFSAIAMRDHIDPRSASGGPIDESDLSKVRAWCRKRFVAAASGPK